LSTQEDARRLIERLAEDDEFRAKMERDPVAAAAEYGFVIDASKLPANGITLPPKDVLRKQADELAARFYASPDVIVIFNI
jgi:putative modified peptide